MKKKFNYKQSQILVEKIDKPSINKRIQELIKEFREIDYSRIKKLYNILSEIVRLKKQTNSRYAPRSLEFEEGLNLNNAQIRFIFSYKYLSNHSKELIQEGKIRDSHICYMMWRFKFLREAQWQDKLTKLYLEGKINRSEISEFNIKDLKTLLLTGKKVNTNDKYIISATKTLRSMLSRLKIKGVSNLNSEYKKNLSNVVNKLNKLLND